VAGIGAGAVRGIAVLTTEGCNFGSTFVSVRGAFRGLMWKPNLMWTPTQRPQGIDGIETLSVDDEDAIFFRKLEHLRQAGFILRSPTRVGHMAMRPCA